MLHLGAGPADSISKLNRQNQCNPRACACGDSAVSRLSNHSEQKSCKAQEAQKQKGPLSEMSGPFLAQSKSGRSVPSVAGLIGGNQNFFLKADEHRGYIGTLVVAIYILVRLGELVTHANVSVGYFVDDELERIHKAGVLGPEGGFLLFL